MRVDNELAIRSHDAARVCGMQAILAGDLFQVRAAVLYHMCVEFQRRWERMSAILRTGEALPERN